MILTAGRAPAVRVLIVIDVRLYRDGLASALSERQGFEIVGAAGSKDGVLCDVADKKPDLVIVDVALADALGLMRALRAQTPATRIVAFAVEDEVSAILDCADAGAVGFVTANASIDELVLAMERAVAGELLCSPRMAAELLRTAVGKSAPPARSPSEQASNGLTSRERQVLGFLQQGMANKEIASALSISEATVKNHVHHVLEKLKVTSRWQAAASTRWEGALDVARGDGTSRPIGLGRRSTPAEPSERGPESDRGLNPN